MLTWIRVSGPEDLHIGDRFSWGSHEGQPPDGYGVYYEVFKTLDRNRCLSFINEKGYDYKEYFMAPSNDKRLWKLVRMTAEMKKELVLYKIKYLDKKYQERRTKCVG